MLLEVTSPAKVQSDVVYVPDSLAVVHTLTASPSFHKSPTEYGTVGVVTNVLDLDSIAVSTSLGAGDQSVALLPFSNLMVGLSAFSNETLIDVAFTGAVTIRRAVPAIPDI